MSWLPVFGRQKHVRASLGGMYAGIVAVVEQGDVVGETVQQVYLLLGKCGARVWTYFLILRACNNLILPHD